jgi:tetratricopeptide (TPR) repeat protein
VAGTARAAFQSGRVDDAVAAYEEAIAGFARHGDVRGQGEALNRLCSVLWDKGETGRARAVLFQAIELLEPEGPSPELCSAYVQMAADRVLSGRSEETPAWADKALTLAEQFGGLPEVKIQALDYRGMARCDLSDFGGLDDLRQALQLAQEVGAGSDAAVLYVSLAEPLWVADGPATALDTCRTGIDFAERRGLARTAMWIRSSSLGPLGDLGRWDEVLALADEVIAQERTPGGYQSVGAATHKAHILLWRGEIAAAQPLVRELLSHARDIDDLQNPSPRPGHWCGRRGRRQPATRGPPGQGTEPARPRARWRPVVPRLIPRGAGQNLHGDAPARPSLRAHRPRADPGGTASACSAHRPGSACRGRG